MDAGLKGSVVLITGASGGIGGATARVFAAEGARVVLHAHRNLDAVKKLQAELGADSMTVQGDVSSEGDVERLFAEIGERFGGVDALVANAGIWEFENVPIRKMSLERWNETLLKDQTSVFICAREFFRSLEKRKPEAASLVIVGSTSAVFGAEGHAEYAAAKAAITYGLTRTLKNEIVRLAPRGRVNAVAPGWVYTAMAEPALKNKKSVSRALQTRALKQIARPEDIAHAIVFLSSDRLAGHITGEILTIAGGMEGRILHQPEDIDVEKA